MKAKLSVLLLVTVLAGLIIFPTLVDNVIISKSFTFESIDKKKVWVKNDTVRFKFNSNVDDAVSLDLFYRINQHYNHIYLIFH